MRPQQRTDAATFGASIRRDVRPRSVRPGVPRGVALLSAAAAGTLLLSACAEAGAGGDGETEDQSAGEVAAGQQVEDDHGTHTLPETIDSIGAFDNRSFRTLQDLGIELSVAPVDLMNDEAHSDYLSDEDILNTGNHNEPDLEQIVAAEPDLIINGQRYSQYYDDIADLLPEESVILEWDEATSDPETFFAGLAEKTQQLGEVFGEQDAAQGVVDDMDEQIDRVEAAYDGESTVMGLLTSGGDINYAGPQEGRGVAPVFQEFDLAPALEVDDQSSDHEGDDISVEAIAQSDPDWLIVMDRDGMAPDDAEYTPARELIADSPALQDVTAVEEDQIVYMPQNMYVTEDIQAYTEFLSDFADALESQSSSGMVESG